MDEEKDIKANNSSCSIFRVGQQFLFCPLKSTFSRSIAIGNITLENFRIMFHRINKVGVGDAKCPKYTKMSFL